MRDMTIEIDDIKFKMLIEDKYIVGKLNETNNTHYILSPITDEGLLKIIENVKAYNNDEPIEIKLENGKWVKI